MQNKYFEKLAVIDLEVGADLIGRQDLAENMLCELADMLPGDLEKLQAAFIDGDYQKLKNQVHYIKGGVSYCGTPRLKTASTHLDLILNKKGDQEEIEASYQVLCDEIKLFLEEFKKFK